MPQDVCIDGERDQKDYILRYFYETLLVTHVKKSPVKERKILLFKGDSMLKQPMKAQEYRKEQKTQEDTNDNSTIYLSSL